MSAKGTQCYKSKDYSQALQCYTAALDLCEVHGLWGDKPVLLGNYSRVCLELGRYEEAFTYATEQLKLDPTCFKVMYGQYEICLHISLELLLDNLCAG